MKMNPLLLSLAIGLGSCFSPDKVSNKSKVIKGMAKTISVQFKDVAQLDIEEFQKRKKSENFQLVDVREKKERLISVIPGSISIEEFQKDPQKYKDRPIVAYCTIGYRSSKWAKQLKKQGFQTYNLKESILGWANRRLPLVNGTEETKKVHVYAEAWNFLPEGYQGVY